MPNIKIIGSTTDGEILNGNISKNKTVLSFSLFEKTAIKIVAVKQEDSNFSFGWKSIGFQFTVTKAIENRVYSIDNQTPVELYKKYLGNNIVEQLSIPMS